MVYHGKEKENHAGSIVQYPILKVNEKDFDIETNPIIRWVKETLTEPVDGQIVCTEESGCHILSHGQYPMVVITEKAKDDEKPMIHDKQLSALLQAEGVLRCMGEDEMAKKLAEIYEKLK